MTLLSPTPLDRLLDEHGRPYFLWDCELTLDEFEASLRADEDGTTVPYLIAKLMRQAKPDDVFRFVTVEQIQRLWPRIAPQLGHKAAFWRWVLQQWEVIERDGDEST